MGTQCWVYCAIMFCEGILCIKNGRELFSQTHTAKVVSWLLIQAALSIMFVTACVFWHKFVQVGHIFRHSCNFAYLTTTLFLSETQRDC